MATVNITFDTVSKELKASIDGSEVASVVGVDFYRSFDDEDEYRMCITQSSQDKESDMRLMTQVCASTSQTAKASADFKPSKFGDFVERKVLADDGLTKAIHAFFGA